MKKAQAAEDNFKGKWGALSTSRKTLRDFWTFEWKRQLPDRKYSAPEIVYLHVTDGQITQSPTEEDCFYTKSKIIMIHVFCYSLRRTFVCWADLNAVDVKLTALSRTSLLMAMF